MAKVTFVSKLSTARRVERSRIWLEGTRLADAGFRVGKTYTKQWSKGKLVLVTGEDKGELGTISGKGDRPIIDIVGLKVRETFPDATHVKVTYDIGRVVIVADESK